MLNLSNNKNETLIQAVKYLFVGGACTCVDFLILYVLTECVGVYYIVSASISFLVGVVINYFMCTYWIFKKSVIKNAGLEFLFYVLISAVGLAINSGGIWLLTTYCGLYFMVSKLFATAITLIWNFCSRKYLLHI